MFHDHHIAEEICGNYLQTLSREDGNKEKMHSKVNVPAKSNSPAATMCVDIHVFPTRPPFPVYRSVTGYRGGRGFGGVEGGGCFVS